MRPTRRDWIPITEAIDVLAERFFDHVAEDWGAAYPAAWQVMERAMADGEARTRASAARWHLEDSGGNVVRYLDAQPEGYLLPTFWFHFSEAKRIHKHGLVTIGDGLGAHQSSDDFWFLQARGIVDELHMVGRAEAVTLWASTLPRGTKTPMERGRPRGPAYSDDQVVDRAAAVIESGKMDYTSAVKRFAPDMPKKEEGQMMTPLSSLKTRLRARLAERGILSKRASERIRTSKK